MTLEGWFGPIVPASQSGAEPSTLSECQGTPERDMSVRLDMTATVESSLPGTVSLLKIEGDNWASDKPNIILGSEAGGGCQISGDNEISFGGIAPHQSSDRTIWLIFPETITPDDPNPSNIQLTDDWRMKVPELSISEDPEGHVEVSGPQVVTCANPLSNTDQFVAITTEISRSLKNVNGEPETDCTA